ncbi:MAG TPA: hypothetical protein VFX76_09600, partial [Roseiflexaceae bacterium]|nr:hypothetical protein [Roseiflexaceae bacterium]
FLPQRLKDSKARAVFETSYLRAFVAVGVAAVGQAVIEDQMTVIRVLHQKADFLPQRLKDSKARAVFETSSLRVFVAVGVAAVGQAVIEDQLRIVRILHQKDLPQRLKDAKTECIQKNFESSSLRGKRKIQ